MKYKRVFEVRAESYEEEQFMLLKFPGSIWFICEGHTKFYLPEEEKKDVLLALKEWRQIEWNAKHEGE